MTRYLRVAGLSAVLLAAAILSFSALRDLAIAVRIDERLAFLLPIAVDAGAAVSCTVWLSPSVRPDARRFACWLTWSLLTATVIGHAAQLGMHANGITPPWWVAVLVGAIPPAVVGGVVHLLVLDGRAATTPVDEPAPVAAEVPAPDPARVDDHGLSLLWSTAPQAEPELQPVPAPAARRKPTPPTTTPDIDMDKARELRAQGAGRVAFQREFGLTEHQAKQLVKSLSTNGHQP